MKHLFKRSKKFLIIGLACCLLAAATTFGVTSAVLYDSAEVSNTFLVGEDKIELIENYQPPQGAFAAEAVFEESPQVKNIGNLPDYVRVRLDFSSLEAEQSCTLLGRDKENWVLKGDGFYYYKLLLLPGETTSPLCTAVQNTGTATLTDFDLYVYAESVQHKDGHLATDWEGAWLI